MSQNINAAHLDDLLIKIQIPVKEMQLKSIKEKKSIQDIFFVTLRYFHSQKSQERKQIFNGDLCSEVLTSIIFSIRKSHRIPRTIF